MQPIEVHMLKWQKPASLFCRVWHYSTDSRDEYSTFYYHDPYMGQRCQKEWMNWFLIIFH